MFEIVFMTKKDLYALEIKELKWYNIIVNGFIPVTKIKGDKK